MASENRIANDLERFHADISSTEELLAQVQATSDKMFTSLDSLNTSWEGSAHNAFVANVNEDRAFMTEVLKTLRTYTESLDAAETTYRTCESDVSNVIAGIRV